MAARRPGHRELGLASGFGGGVANYQGTVDSPDVQQPDAPSTGEIALQGLMQIGKGIAQQSFNNSVAETYVRGQLARDQGIAQDAMDVDPLMRPFANGGYNDQDYRIKAAEFDQEYKRWLDSEGRQYSPDDPKVAEFIARNNTDVMQAIDAGGMTEKAKLAALANQTQANATRVAKHYEAHRKFVLEEFAKRVTPQGNQIIAELSQAQVEGNPLTYDAAQGKAVRYWQSIMADDTVPVELREEISNRFLSGLISTEQRAPVQSMLASGLLDSMPMQDREKLHVAIRESEARTRNKDAAGEIMQDALVHAQALKKDIPVEEYADYLQRMMLDSKLTYTQAVANLQKVLKVDPTADDRTKKLDLANAIRIGQMDGPKGIYALTKGAGPSKALEIIDLELRKAGVDTVQRLTTITEAGLRLGAIPDSHGEALGNAVRAVGSAKADDPVLPEYINTLQVVASQVDVATRNDPSKAGLLLAAMPEDTRGAMAHVLQQARNGVEPQTALRNYMAKSAELQQATPADKARRQSTWWDEHRKTILSEGASAPLLGGWAGGLFDETPDTTQTLQLNMWSELRQLDSNPAYWAATEEEKVAVAKGNILKRTIPINTTEGKRPVVLDEQTSVGKLFGGYQAAEVGEALDGILGSSDNQHYVVWDRVNQVFRQDERLEDGQFIPVRTVQPAEILTKLQERDNKITQEAMADALGTEFKVKDTTLYLSGRNGSGEPSSTVRLARTIIAEAQPDALVRNSAPDITPQAMMLHETDRAVSAAVRKVAPHYTKPTARAAVIAGVYLEGAEKMAQIIEAADAAWQAGDTAAFNEALNLVQDSTVRERLRTNIPVASPANVLRNRN